MKCPKCNFESPEGQKFCGECGAPLESIKAPEERRLVTVLFADLSGFTALTQGLDPEEVMGVANICFEYLNNSIIKQSGTIHKYEGDLVIALFGLPTSHEDDPERAIKSALEMIRVMSEINEALKSSLKRKVNLGLHIGINSGTVVAGAVGSQEKKEYTVMGEAVNLASRLMNSAKPNEILVSEPVFRASRYLFDYEVLSPLTLKGIEEPVRVFKPLKIKDKPQSKRGIRGLYSPLVGRDEEFERLKQTVEKLPKGKGGAVFILGDAGLGKSRLLEELKSYLSHSAFHIPHSAFHIPQSAISPSLLLPVSSVLILEGRCLSYGENITYWPFLQILKDILGIDDSDSLKVIQEKIVKKCQELFLENWQEIVPYIAYLFSIRFTDELDERVKYLDAQALKIQIFLSLRKLLLALSKKYPLILVIEDYHWIDSASLELLEFIFEGSNHSDLRESIIAEVPLLFIGLSRIEKDKEFWRVKERIKEKLQDNFLEITLSPLNFQASNALVHNLLKILAIPKELKEKILSKAEGNPFFLEEIIRSFIDLGVLMFDGNTWKLAGNGQQLASIEIPDTVQAVIATRLDRLEQDVKDVLQMASVIGRSFYKRVLEYISHMDNLMLDLYLAALEEFEFIKEQNRIPELEYIFKHPLLQEVTYNGLLKSKRKALHLKTAESIEKMFPDRISDFCELLSEQYYRAEEWTKAFQYSEMQAKKAKDVYANREAINAYERALEVAPKANKLSETPRLLLALGGIFTLQGENDKALGLLQRALKEAMDENMQFEIYSQFATLYEKMSKYDESLRYLKLAEFCLSDGMSIKKVRLLRATAWIQYLRGEIPQALKTLEEASFTLNQLEDEDEKEKDLMKARLLSQKGGIYADLGDTQRTIDFYQESLALYKKHSDLLGISVIYNNLGHHLQEVVKFSQSIEMLENALQIDEKIGNSLGYAIVCNNLGEIYYYLNNLERSQFYFSVYAGINAKIQNRLGDGYAMLGFGRIHQKKGENEVALEMYHKALDIFDEVKSERMHYFALTDLIDFHIQTNEFSKAELLIQEVISYAESKEIKALLTTAYTLLGEMALKRAKKGEKEFPLRIAQINLEKALKLAEEGKNIVDIFEIKRELSKVTFFEGDRQRFRAVLEETHSILNLIKSGIEDEVLREKFLNKPEIQEFLALPCEREEKEEIK
ncbi:MAG: adenylate/guanylate cyclase domain-containing protein [Candidatus Edwardsbacteria bacterium]